MVRRNNLFSRSVQFGFESLEARSLLSGFHASAATAKVDDHRAAFVSGVTAGASQKSAASAQQSETHLVATLVDPANPSQVLGTAKYESETEHGRISSEFSASVKGATPGATIAVSIDDGVGKVVSVGQIIVAADGTGKLKVKSNLPAVTDKSVVSLSVTDTTTGVSTVIASGTFVTPVSNPGGSHDDSDEHDEMHLTANFADPSSKLTGSAKYESEIEHGLIVSELSVSVKGATAGANIAVSIDDGAGNVVSVGQFKVGAKGTGKLTVKSNLPAVTDKSVVILSTVNADGTLTNITSAAFAVAASTRRSS